MIPTRVQIQAKLDEIKELNNKVVLIREWLVSLHVPQKDIDMIIDDLESYN